jgi:hypothetical protein
MRKVKEARRREELGLTLSTSRSEGKSSDRVTEHVIDGKERSVNECRGIEGGREVVVW